MVPRENKNNHYAKFGGTNKEYYGIFRTGLYSDIMRFTLLHNRHHKVSQKKSQGVTKCLVLHALQNCYYFVKD